MDLQHSLINPMIGPLHWTATEERWRINMHFLLFFFSWLFALIFSLCQTGESSPTGRSRRAMERQATESSRSSFYSVRSPRYLPTYTPIITWRTWLCLPVQLGGDIVPLPPNSPPSPSARYPLPIPPKSPLPSDPAPTPTAPPS